MSRFLLCLLDLHHGERQLVLPQPASRTLAVHPAATALLVFSAKAPQPAGHLQASALVCASKIDYLQFFVNDKVKNTLKPC